MGKRDKRIDTYILKSADFAIPILTHLRELVHLACPDVAETIKWSFPVFEYKGILCKMAAFMQHCACGFWKACLMKDKSLVKQAARETAMGHLGKIQSLKDLPPDKVLIQLIKEAAKLNDSGIKVAKKSATESKALLVPPYFKKALNANPLALKTFTNFSYSKQKEYVEWITDAKTDVTREKRIVTAIEWLAEGKVRNWKYIHKK